jgi:TPR repeat protein
VWFSLAASQGHSDGSKHRELTAKQMTAAQIVEAQFELGARYGKGQDVPEDIPKAVTWFTLAAEQGHAEAQFALSLILAYDAQLRGVTPDEAEIARWSRMAAEQGHANAQLNLGISQAKGAGDYRAC